MMVKNIFLNTKSSDVQKKNTKSSYGRSSTRNIYTFVRIGIRLKSHSQALYVPQFMTHVRASMPSKPFRNVNTFWIVKWGVVWTSQAINEIRMPPPSSLFFFYNTPPPSTFPNYNYSSISNIPALARGSAPSVYNYADKQSNWIWL